MLSDEVSAAHAHSRIELRQLKSVHQHITLKTPVFYATKRLAHQFLSGCLLECCVVPHPLVVQQIVILSKHIHSLNHPPVILLKNLLEDGNCYFLELNRLPQVIDFVVE